MRSTIRHAGLDVHKNTITVAVADPGIGEPEPGTTTNGWMAFQRRVEMSYYFVETQVM